MTETCDRDEVQVAWDCRLKAGQREIAQGFEVIVNLPVKQGPEA